MKEGEKGEGRSCMRVAVVTGKGGKGKAVASAIRERLTYLQRVNDK